MTPEPAPSPPKNQSKSGKSRALESWVEGFYLSTDGSGSPSLYRKWTAISILSAALERRVWLRTGKGVLYPNLYVFLIGPPGVGKTVMTQKAAIMLRTLKTHHIASSSVTKASLMDELREATRSFVRPGQNPPTESFNSLTVVSNELGVFLTAYEGEFMSVLTDLYDGHPYSERRRSKEICFDIEKPILNVLAATQPGYLTELLPEVAWDQGFMSRVLMIFSAENTKQRLFHFSKEDEKINKALERDLKLIGDLHGKFELTADAVAAIEEWHAQDGPPKPEHPKLQNYCIRRIAQLLKLCMISAVSRGDDLLITLENFREAVDWLLEAEVYMEDIFKSMGARGDSRVIEEAWHFAYHLFTKKQQPIPAHYLVQFLQERTPAYNVDKILQLMVRSRILEQVEVNKVGPCFRPRPRRPGE